MKINTKLSHFQPLLNIISHNENELIVHCNTSSSLLFKEALAQTAGMFTRMKTYFEKQVFLLSIQALSTNYANEKEAVVKATLQTASEEAFSYHITAYYDKKCLAKCDLIIAARAFPNDEKSKILKQNFEEYYEKISTN